MSWYLLSKKMMNGLFQHNISEVSNDSLLYKNNCNIQLFFKHKLLKCVEYYFGVIFDLLIFLILFLREGRHWRAIRWPFGGLLESKFCPFLQWLMSKPYKKGQVLCRYMTKKTCSSCDFKTLQDNCLAQALGRLAKLHLSQQKNASIIFTAAGSCC